MLHKVVLKRQCPTASLCCITSQKSPYLKIQLLICGSYKNNQYEVHGVCMRALCVCVCVCVHTRMCARACVCLKNINYKIENFIKTMGNRNKV